MASKQIHVALVALDYEGDLLVQREMLNLEAQGAKVSLFRLEDLVYLPDTRNALLKEDPRLVVFFPTSAGEQLHVANYATELARRGHKGMRISAQLVSWRDPGALLEECPALDALIALRPPDGLVPLLSRLEHNQSIEGLPGLTFRDTKGPPGTTLIADPGPVWTHHQLYNWSSSTVLGIPAAPVLTSLACSAACPGCAAGHPGDAIISDRALWVGRMTQEIEAGYRRGARIFVFHSPDPVGTDSQIDPEWGKLLADRLEQQGLTDVRIVLKMLSDEVTPETLEPLRRAGLIRVSLRHRWRLPGEFDARPEPRTPILRNALTLLRAQGVVADVQLLGWEPGPSLEALMDIQDCLREFSPVAFRWLWLPDFSTLRRRFDPNRPQVSGRNAAPLAQGGRLVRTIGARGSRLNNAWNGPYHRLSELIFLRELFVRTFGEDTASRGITHERLQSIDQAIRDASRVMFATTDRLIETTQWGAFDDEVSGSRAMNELERKLEANHEVFDNLTTARRWLEEAATPGASGGPRELAGRDLRWTSTGHEACWSESPLDGVAGVAAGAGAGAGVLIAAGLGGAVVGGAVIAGLPGGAAAAPGGPRVPGMPAAPRAPAGPAAPAAPGIPAGAAAAAAVAAVAAAAAVAAVADAAEKPAAAAGAAAAAAGAAANAPAAAAAAAAPAAPAAPAAAAAAAAAPAAPAAAAAAAPAAAAPAAAAAAPAAPAGAAAPAAAAAAAPAAPAAAEAAAGAASGARASDAADAAVAAAAGTAAAAGAASQAAATVGKAAAVAAPAADEGDGDQAAADAAGEPADAAAKQADAAAKPADDSAADDKKSDAASAEKAGAADQAASPAADEGDADAAKQAAGGAAKAPAGAGGAAKAADRPAAGAAADKAGDKAGAKAADKAADKAGAKAGDKEADKAAGKGADKAAGKADEKGADKADKAAGKAAGGGAGPGAKAPAAAAPGADQHAAAKAAAAKEAADKAEAEKEQKRHIAALAAAQEVDRAAQAAAEKKKKEEEAKAARDGDPKKPAGPARPEAEAEEEEEPQDELGKAAKEAMKAIDKVSKAAAAAAHDKSGKEAMKLIPLAAAAIPVLLKAGALLEKAPPEPPKLKDLLKPKLPERDQKKPGQAGVVPAIPGPGGPASGPGGPGGGPRDGGKDEDDGRPKPADHPDRHDGGGADDPDGPPKKIGPYETKAPGQSRPPARPKPPLPELPEIPEGERPRPDSPDDPSPFSPSAPCKHPVINLSAPNMPSIFASLVKLNFMSKFIMVPTKFDPGMLVKFRPDDPAFEIGDLAGLAMSLIKCPSPFKMHVSTAIKIGKQYESFIEDVSRGIILAWNLTALTTKFTGVLINGPIGMLNPGGMIPGPLMKWPIMTVLGVPWGVKPGLDNILAIVQGFKIAKAINMAIADGFNNWAMAYMNSAIPFPGGAVALGSMIPSPNIPIPLVTGNSAAESMLSPSALKGAMVGNLGTPGNHTEALCDSFAKAFNTMFTLWKSTNMIMLVLGAGGVAPAPVPGPVAMAMGNGGMILGMPVL